MPNKSLITLNNVSKKYRLYDHHANRLLEALHPFRKRYHHEFWAVRDVSLQIMPGQTIGIVGRNGSGKSTLLQMIAGILTPSSGSVELDNTRISALLELGAGFNPSLTGRENVYIHGALMGYDRAEMDEKMTAIANFADIGHFFDQPVKFYSSGMFVRVAFSAAIHVEPDVLIVDEAISVGDAKFQHKCYQKFREFQKKGVTIVFVSHDTNAVTRVCDHVVLLERGTIVADGPPDKVINAYLELILGDALDQTAGGAAQASGNPVKPSKTSTDSGYIMDFFEENSSELPRVPTRASYNKDELRIGGKRAEIADYLLVNSNGQDIGSVVSGDTVSLYIKAVFHAAIEVPVYGISIKTKDGVVIYATNTRIKQTRVQAAKTGETIFFRYIIPVPLREGDYFIDLGLTEAINDATDESILDVHYSLIYLRVSPPKELFDGLVELPVIPEEVQISQILNSGSENANFVRK